MLVGRVFLGVILFSLSSLAMENDTASLVRDNIKAIKTNKALNPGENGKYLVGADLSNHNFAMVDFSDANLTNANLRNSKFALASMKNAILKGTDFSGADLRMLNSDNSLEFLLQQGAKWDEHNPPLVGNSITINENENDFKEWKAAKNRYFANDDLAGWKKWKY